MNGGHSKWKTVSAILSCLVLLAMGLSLSGCSETASQPEGNQEAVVLTPKIDRQAPSQKAQADVPSLVSGNTACALDLFGAVRKIEGNAARNLTLSPYSLSHALGMTFAGARGETESQMAAVLHLTLPPDALHPASNALDHEVVTSDEAEGATFAGADSLWPLSVQDDEILPEYLDLVRGYYGASVTRPPSDNEEARKAINAWVADSTEGRVEEVLPPEWASGKPAVMVLADAVSFSGRWTFAFPEQSTEEGLFTLADGSAVSTTFMSHNREFGYVEDETWQAVELPYGPKDAREWGDYSMVCLLPKEAGLEEAIPGLSTGGLKELLAGLSADDLVHVTMPRFVFDSELRFKEVCRSLGMTDAFDPGTADFSGMFAARVASGICIDEIYQTATISVDERGTEAAAGSAVVMVKGLGQKKIVLDHPFLFLIQHRPTGAILFMGQVMNPAED
jgi:serpin B